MNIETVAAAPAHRFHEAAVNSAFRRHRRPVAGLLALHTARAIDRSIVRFVAVTDGKDALLAALRDPDAERPAIGRWRWFRFVPAPRTQPTLASPHPVRDAGGAAQWAWPTPSTRRLRTPV